MPLRETFVSAIPDDPYVFLIVDITIKESYIHGLMVRMLAKFNAGGDSSYPIKEDVHKGSL
jgi:hypothetical protein